MWTHALSRLKRLSAGAKVGVVAGGYLLALTAAGLVLMVYVALTSGPGRDASAGMYAFGDALLFLMVLGAASTPSTLLALYFLRPVRAFWVSVCATALGVSLTGLVAAVTVADPHLSVSGIWGALAVPRLFLAPVFAVLFALTAMLSYRPRYRWWLIAAAGVEGLTSAYGFSHWFAPLLFGTAT